MEATVATLSRAAMMENVVLEAVNCNLSVKVFGVFNDTTDSRKAYLFRVDYSGRDVTFTLRNSTVALLLQSGFSPLRRPATQLMYTLDAAVFSSLNATGITALVDTCNIQLSVVEGVFYDVAPVGLSGNGMLFGANSEHVSDVSFSVHHTVWNFTFGSKSTTPVYFICSSVMSVQTSSTKMAVTMRNVTVTHHMPNMDEVYAGTVWCCSVDVDDSKASSPSWTCGACQTSPHCRAFLDRCFGHLSSKRCRMASSLLRPSLTG
jgi:hypothetical protein